MQEERGHARQPRTQKETVSSSIIWEGQRGIGVIDPAREGIGLDKLGVGYAGLV